ncbi:hypothetical protein D3C77_731040 [compost metagenome]
MLNEGAVAARIVPKINNNIEVMNICRVVNFCIRIPVTGTRMPNVKKYPVASHCTVVGPTLNN